MSKLLQSLDKPQVKVAYQSYKLTHGIESLTLLVPVSQSTVFEERFAKLETKSKSAITSLVEELNGKVKDNG